ncbi:patatin-like phospholipase family protein, putative [Ichthyophthirius multifiliis]|uniref:Patatin-like phospholipase family protein, putative n=1 Tax=Ichthyophthirius multifiliis TaxID=5932 RepID=G0R3A7_ICHMU|nr:patatin-like phospholipase family protein, putative [Ichthyophthirius multifiliis]EGR28050.1 patatin-like phospholipase family protein, putative [Ichthyophthirius multifiliis]|eukprot:XP_004027395.1 patatin-like phospholipase family protein, putative [Ichthyophthirius multifiliis]
MQVYKNFIRDNIGDITFQQAYDLTGFVLNITVTGSGQYIQDRVLNYLTSPNVVIWSAVCCSCSLPGVFPPQDLLCKESDGSLVKYVEYAQFIDGSIAFDVPHIKLQEMFNVNTFIVSQVNPYVIPLLDHSQSIRHRNKMLLFTLKILEVIKSIIFDEIKARFSQLSKLGILPHSFIKTLNLIYQKYEGDITIWPAPKLTDYFNIFKNPTCHEFVEKYTKAGAQRCYQKLSHIQFLTKFERIVNECYQNLKNQEVYMKKINEIQRNISFDIPIRQT